MYCKKCGNKLNEDEKYCKNCGQDKDAPVKLEVKKANNNAKISNTFGVASLIVGFFLSILSLPLGIIGIVYYFKNKKEANEKCYGLAFSIAGIVVGIITCILWCLFIGFVIDEVEKEFERESYRDRYQYRYNYDDNYNYNYGRHNYQRGRIFTESVSTWQQMVKQDSYLITVFMQNNCEYCSNYRAELNDLIDDENVNIVLFNTDYLSDTDKTSLFNTFSNLKSISYPYTIITKNGQIIDEIKGYVDQDILEDKLENLGVIDNNTL